jgi:GNAT superfamily N-acetyltransferase
VVKPLGFSYPSKEPPVELWGSGKNITRRDMIRVMDEIVYPWQYQTEVLLQDGTSYLVRPIRAEDTAPWIVFVDSLSQQTRFLRFHFFPGTMTEADALHFCTVDYDDSFALVAEISTDGQRQIMAIARYYRLSPRDHAEMAIVVADAYQRRGVGTRLFNQLVVAARDQGITAFTAEVLVQNQVMLDVFRGSGYPLSITMQAGVYSVVISLGAK